MKSISFKLLFILSLFSVVFLCGCKKDEVALSTVNTASISGITTTSAILGGDISDVGTGEISEKGFCWKTSSNPTINDNKINVGNGIGPFKYTLGGLSKNRLYYVKTYAINEAGIAYGNEVMFSANPYLNQSKVTGSVQDIEGNIYPTVNIAGKEWFADNLRTTHYANGDEIPNITSNNVWANQTAGACCTNEYIGALDSVYGYFYNFYAVSDPRNVCPTGWHVPTHDEMLNLVAAEGGASIAGGKLKSTLLWSTSDGTNESGFTALPGNFKDGIGGQSGMVGNYGYFWTSSLANPTQAYGLALFYYNNKSYNSLGYFDNGSSIRCIQD